MPIFRTEQGLVYFAHVPGCGGAAVIRHLEARFGPAAFHDPAHTDAPPARRWSRTSPQHVGRRTLSRLFPPGFFAAELALVRHPVERMRAVYAFQREVEGAIPEATGFGEWLEDIAERREEEPFVFDNAVRPMTDLVPEGAEAFRLEDAARAFLARLDGLGGVPAEAPDLAAVPGNAPRPSEADLDLVARLFAGDCARFGYEVEAASAPRRRFAGVLRGPR